MDHEEMRRVVVEARKKHEEQSQTASKKRLINNIQRKFNTTMIGSISVIEKYFGYLWGYGKNYDELDVKQKKMREIWEEARTDILNNGNNQLRAALDEIAQYSMTWDRYRAEFIIRKKGE